MNREELFQLHDELCEQAKDLMSKKNQDYANNENPFHNFFASQSIGVHPAKGILLRCLDKFARMSSYIDRGELSVADESFEDSAVDTINYMILLIGLMRSEREKLKPVQIKEGVLVNDHQSGPLFITTHPAVLNPNGAQIDWSQVKQDQHNFNLEIQQPVYEKQSD